METKQNWAQTTPSPELVRLPRMLRCCPLPLHVAVTTLWEPHILGRYRCVLPSRHRWSCLLVRMSLPPRSSLVNQAPHPHRCSTGVCQASCEVSPPSRYSCLERQPCRCG